MTTKAADRRAAGETIAAMREELSVRWIEVTIDDTGVYLDWHSRKTGLIKAGNLDDAFIALAHELAGTEPAPF